MPQAPLARSKSGQAGQPSVSAATNTASPSLANAPPGARSNPRPTCAPPLRSIPPMQTAVLAGQHPPPGVEAVAPMPFQPPAVEVHYAHHAAQQPVAHVAHAHPAHAHAPHGYAWHTPPSHFAGAPPPTLAHRAFAYPMHPQLIPVVQHGGMTPYGHVAPPHAHLHAHPHAQQLHPAVATYAAPVAVQQAPFAHFYSPHLSIGQHPHVPLHEQAPQQIFSVQQAQSSEEQKARTFTASQSTACQQSAGPSARPRAAGSHAQHAQHGKPTSAPSNLPGSATKRETSATQQAAPMQVIPPADPKMLPNLPEALPNRAEPVAIEKALHTPSQGGSSKRPREKSDAQQPIRKSRKPYTITKNRECWSKPEHTRFLEALRLYNRDWKKIEAHVGTKTVLQIRSHAQKHFGKVAKYNTGEYIPPARPKRRSSQPYPRSRNVVQKHSAAPPNNPPPTANANATAQGSGGSDNGGASDNGNVSANGMDTGAGSSNPAKPPGLDGPSSRQQSVDRCSDYMPGVGQPRNPKTPTEQQQPPASSVVKTEQAMPNRETVCSVPLPCLPVTTPAIPGSYEHYYFNVLRPNGLPYGTGFYQSNHYPAHHPAYAWQDQACRQPSTCQVDTNGAPAHASASRAGNVHNQEASAKTGATAKGEVPQPEQTPLHVLSNCVDMVAQQMTEKPAPGWASAAAARRAHRARVIRERKRTTASSGATQKESKAKSKEPGPPSSVDGANSSRPAPASESNMKSEDTAAASKDVQVPQPTQREADVLIPPNDVGVVDVGSDEAVAGFSGSDRQESDGAAGGSTGRTTPSSEEDPNSSSNDGDDGRHNTRGSSPADPNSGGSREGSSGPETNPDNAPSNSRRQSPDEPAKRADGEAADTNKTPSANQASSTRSGDTVKGAAKVLSDYNTANENQAAAAAGGDAPAASRNGPSSVPKNPKSAIGALLNEAPSKSFAAPSAPSVPVAEETMGKQPKDQGGKD